ncbi:MAG: Hsp20/alpha crystallin family protein [Desulfobacterales bacterium]|nr:Hsp20/alpha crystallin family protein [Desulfobacterales bacterium]
MALVPVRKRERGKGELTRLHDEMDDLFRSFFEPWETPGLGHRHWPAIDIGETDDAFMVKAEVPGCKADDIDISVHGNMLTISGEKKQEEEKKEKGYYHMERSYGSFRRDMNLASEVDPAKIEATCKDGVLSLKLPKTEKAKPIKVKVKES